MLFGLVSRHYYSTDCRDCLVSQCFLGWSVDINVVLFNPDDCVAVSSDLVEVKGIDLKLDEPLIYKVGTPKLKEEMTNLDWMK